MHARRAQLPLVAALALVAVIVGCGAPTAPAADRAIEMDRPAVVKRVVAGLLAPEPTEVWLPGGLGFGPLGETVTAGLGNVDNRGVYFPELAEAIPSIENGSWKVFPDGRMETSWTIRQGARWHDSIPITTEDLLFSILVNQDREAFGIGHPGLAFIERTEALDARTIRVTRTQPYTGAEQMFSRSAGGNPLAFPWPKHLLERTYLDDKATFAQQRYWSTDFVALARSRSRNGRREATGSSLPTITTSSAARKSTRSRCASWATRRRSSRHCSRATST
jgi:ABC-type transport system substrate-binding protein